MSLGVEAQTPVNPSMEAVSFSDYQQDWLAGRINLQDLFAIPRRPDVIGTVPNQEAFTAMSLVPREFTRFFYGEHGCVTDEMPEEVVDVYRPTLDIILADSQQRGLYARRGLEITLFQRRACDYPSYNYTPHIDVGDLFYLVADRKPTKFFVGSFATSAFITSHLNGAEVDEMVRASGAVDSPFVPEPYEIVAFDETIPHASQTAYGQEQIRTMVHVRP